MGWCQGGVHGCVRFVHLDLDLWAFVLFQFFNLYVLFEDFTVTLFDSVSLCFFSRYIVTFWVSHIVVSFWTSTMARMRVTWIGSFTQSCRRESLTCVHDRLPTGQRSVWCLRNGIKTHSRASARVFAFTVGLEHTKTLVLSFPTSYEKNDGLATSNDQDYWLARPYKITLLRTSHF